MHLFTYIYKGGFFVAYKALYRKWRPDTFDTVIGQEHITKTLKNEILENRIAHAYLFTGTRGTGKTSTAKILSRAINCLNQKDGNPCNECDVCKGIINETVMDIIEIDAASNTGVDNIRSIIEQVQYTPTVAKYKVYIIDEVHMLSQGAFNALLKTLEEPPHHVVFILATTEVHKIPATILSRCQRFDFKTISIPDITSRIKNILENENILANDDAIEYVAYLANGSMRDSLSILDQCLAFKRDGLTYDDVVNNLGGLDDTTLYKIAEYVGKNDTKSALEEFYSLLESGKNIDDFSTRLLDAFTKIMVSNVSGGEVNHSLSKSRNELIFKVSKLFSNEQIMFCIEILNDLITNLRFSKSAKTLIEASIIKMCESDLCDTKSALLKRIKDLEDKVYHLMAGSFVPAKEVKTETHSQPPSYKDVPFDVDDKTNLSAAENPPNPAEEKPAVKDNIIKEEKKETVKKDDTSFDASSGSITEKIAASWSEVVNRSIKDGSLTVYFAINNTIAVADGQFLIIRARDEEGREKIINNKEKIKEYILKLFNASCEIKAETSEAKVQTFEKEDVFDKFDDLSKKFPQNFNKGEI
ncbi:MAG: DNA polymerase III subunit gamma/tau [Ruminococcaceae bacterium]|nr:DNA polymerase III subunit gamma/tau [Oscillospiraceae bacterium]